MAEYAPDRRRGIYTCLVPAGDPDALAQAMLGLLRNPQRATALGQAARTWVERYGSLETMAMRYAQLYDGTRHDNGTRDGHAS